jgi:hypothetical protein
VKNVPLITVITGETARFHQHQPHGAVANWAFAMVTIRIHDPTIHMLGGHSLTFDRLADGATGYTQQSRDFSKNTRSRMAKAVAPLSASCMSETSFKPRDCSSTR